MDNLVDVGSWNNKVLSNTVIGNGYGVTCIQNNTVSNNQIIANQRGGIGANPNCLVTDNFVSANLGNGIRLSNISGCTLLGNNITRNKGYGIGFEFGPNATIKGNYISKNNVGIWIGAAFFNNIISNTVIENDDFGIQMEGPHHDNLIYHNNFIDNNKGGTQATIAKHWVYPDLFKRLGPHVTPRPPQYVGGAANAWDDGVEGNYWSDCQSADNKPYYINENNQDNHPLKAPHAISSLEMPTKIVTFPPAPTQPPKESNSTPTSTIETEPAPFPITLAIASIATVATAGMCMLVYFKKHRR